MKIKADKVGFNQYKTRKQYFEVGIAHLKDALIGIFSLGYYQGYYSSDVSTKILRHAIDLRRSERSVAKASPIKGE